MLCCRSCGQDVSGGVRCPRCGAELGCGDAARTTDDSELVVVLRTSDPKLLPVIESVLEAAGIPHAIQGKEAAGLFPLGPFGGGMFRHGLGAAVLVPLDRADEARELLEGCNVEDAQE